jgi:hypothetical protein
LFRTSQIFIPRLTQVPGYQSASPALNQAEGTSSSASFLLLIIPIVEKERKMFQRLPAATSYTTLTYQDYVTVLMTIKKGSLDRPPGQLSFALAVFTALFWARPG